MSTQEQTKDSTKAPRFEFLCGTGTIRAKNAQDAVIRQGQISVPNVGQCFIDGIHGYRVASATLNVLRASDRKKVGSLVLPVGRQERLEGRLVIGEGQEMETWKVVATLRRGEAGAYRALRLPDVKIAREDRVARLGKYAVA